MLPRVQRPRPGVQPLLPPCSGRGPARRRCCRDCTRRCRPCTAGAGSAGPRTEPRRSRRRVQRPRTGLHPLLPGMQCTGTAVHRQVPWVQRPRPGSARGGQPCRDLDGNARPGDRPAADPAANAPAVTAPAAAPDGTARPADEPAAGPAATIARRLPLRDVPRPGGTAAGAGRPGARPSARIAHPAGRAGGGDRDRDRDARRLPHSAAHRTSRLRDGYDIRAGSGSCLDSGTNRSGAGAESGGTSSRTATVRPSGPGPGEGYHPPTPKTRRCRG